MVREGRYKCLDCGSIESEVLYKLPSGRAVIRILKNISNQLKAEVVDGNIDIFEVSLDEQKNGIPYAFRIRYFYNGELNLEFVDVSNRICRKCYERKITTNLMMGSGIYPQCYISVIGPVSAGKDALINSIICVSNAQIQEYRIVPCHHSDNKVKCVATQMSELGDESKKEFFILDKNDEIKMSLVFINTPGEILASGKKDFLNYSTHMERISSSDAVILVVDPMRSSVISNSGAGYNEENVNLHILLEGILKNKPMAICCSKSDILKDMCISRGDGLYGNDGYILNANYMWLRDIGVGTDVKRMALCMNSAKSVVRQLFPELRIVSANRKKTGYFIVSNGKPLNSNSSAELNVAEATNQNVLLRWLLAEIANYSFSEGGAF